jgi:hypothetical protein
MSTSHSARRAIAAALFSLGAASAVHAGSDVATDPCVFEKYAVRSVEPYRTEETLSFGSYTRLRGAQLYIDAREGLTVEWLTLSVRRSLAQHAGVGGSQACKPVVPQIQVRVVSAGSGFWVQLGAPDERSSEALLRWARAAYPAASKL